MTATAGGPQAGAACGFCGRGPEQVTRLIAGQASWICADCVRVCSQVLADVESRADSATEPTGPDVPAQTETSAEPRTPTEARTPPEARPSTEAAAGTVAADPVMAASTSAQTLAVAGERVAARAAFEQLWEQVGPDGDPLHVVSIGHYLADLQEDPAEELRWDLLALAAADSLTDSRAQRYHASLPVRGFYPSLHLNVAADYHRLNRDAEARRHVESAAAALADARLGPDGYGGMIRDGIERLRAELGEKDHD